MGVRRFPGARSNCHSNDQQADVSTTTVNPSQLDRPPGGLEGRAKTPRNKVDSRYGAQCCRNTMGIHSDAQRVSIYASVV